MDNFTKIVRLGHSTDTGNVYCKIEYRDGRLSISGVEGPYSGGNCKGSCGQIVMSLNVDTITPAPGWTTEGIKRFIVLWERWHLNDMQAGSPRQMRWLRENPIKAVYPESHYEKAKEALRVAGLEPDNGYSYGSKWLHEDIPDEVLRELAELPDTDKQPAWV